MIFQLLYCGGVLRKKLLGLDVRDVRCADVNGVGNLHKDVLGEGSGESDCVKFVLGLAMGNQDGHESLGDVTSRARWSPWLSE